MEVGSVQACRVDALEGEHPNGLAHEATKFEVGVLRARRLKALDDLLHIRVLAAEFEEAQVGEVTDTGVLG